MNTSPNALPHDQVMATLFREDPELARESLNHALEEGSLDDIMILMRQLALAHGGVASLAADAGLNKKSLYRTLSRSGNPQFATVRTLCKAMGLRLSVNPAA